MLLVNLDLANACSMRKKCACIIDYCYARHHQEECVLFRTCEPRSQLDSIANAMETFQIESCVRGHHIYKGIWNSSSGEKLTCSREIENTKDLFAVAVKRRRLSRKQVK